MIYLRMILSGVIIWTLVVSTFAIMDSLPAVRESQNLQGVVILLFIPLYALLGAWFFYKKGYAIPGFVTGLVVTLTALTLDALITVPFIEIPKGGSYQAFFTNGLLWALAAINIIIIGAYGRYRKYLLVRGQGMSS